MARKPKKKSSKSNREKARQQAQDRERGSGGLDTLQDIPRDTEFFKPKMGKGKKGKNNFSVVPYIVSIGNHPFQDEGEYWHECTYWRHKTGTGTDTKSYICLRKTAQVKGSKCPICDYMKTADSEEQEELKPKQRQLFNIIDHEDENKGVQIFDISPHNFGLMLEDEEKVQEDDFPDQFYGDAEEGLAILARFDEGKFSGASFPDVARIDFEERDDLEDDILEEAIDFDAALRVHSYEDLEDLFHERETGGEEEEEEERPRSKKKKGASKKKSRRRDREEEEEEEEEEEKPRRSRKKKTGKKKKKKDEEECPFEYEFGVDCDQYTDCDDCEVWTECRDKKDELEAE